MYASVFRFAVSEVLSHRPCWSDRVMLTLGAMCCMHLSCYLLVLLMFKNKKQITLNNNYQVSHYTLLVMKTFISLIF